MGGMATDNQLGVVIRTADGSLTLSHPAHGECYHSHTGAEAEARELYVAASGVLGAFAVANQPVHVLDVGLGLAYNAMATFEAWRAAPAPPALTLTSLEVAPELVEALASGRAPWQENWSAWRLALCTGLIECASGVWTATLAHEGGTALATWRIVVADAAQAPLPEAPAGGYSHVWQDPFSPQLNPALWTREWFAKVAAQAVPGCRLMTYSVARSVREALAAGGWRWAKIPSAQPTKRHWLTATPALSTT
jgi:tRNA U34 5-methylaminomethyl-2-thiouridine-forming methyltransferase MnmC